MIIGSTAMKHWFPDYREPKDIDAFSPDRIEGVDTFWHESFPAEWAEDRIADPDFLYTLKISHSFWELRNGSWGKHMSDLHFLQRSGAVFSQKDYDILYPVWKAEHGAKRTNLAQNKDNFFADAVNRKYDHDSIHESVAYNDRPWYLSILKDGEEVLTDWNKFMALSHEDQLQLMREEIYATALERKVIPSDYTCSPRAAYAWALRRTITSLFKGKWALHLVLNYGSVYKPDIDYVALHKSKSDKLILL